jgi:hypothetical protein
MPKAIPLTTWYRAAIALLLLLMAATAWAADDEKYEIRLDRPDVVGDKFKISAEGAMIRRAAVVLDEKRREQDPVGMGIKLEGTLEVLAVTPKGKMTKLSVTVDQCARVSGPDESELLPKGSVIIAEADGDDTKFSLKDGELKPEASGLLELLFHLSADDARATDDELFGTKEKQPVGGEWPMNAKRAAEDYVAEGVKVDPADVNGTVKLEGVEKAGDTERLKLSGRMTVKKLQPKKPRLAELPNGQEVGSTDFHFMLKVPRDPDDRSGEESISARHKMTSTGTLPGGKTVRQEMTLERATQMKRTPMK